LAWLGFAAFFVFERESADSWAFNFHA